MKASTIIYTHLHSSVESHTHVNVLSDVMIPNVRTDCVADCNFSAVDTSLYIAILEEFIISIRPFSVLQSGPV